MHYESQIIVEGFSEGRCYACQVFAVDDDGSKKVVRRFGLKRFNKRIDAEMATGKFIKKLLQRRENNGQLYN